jgi:hypothetical protein
LICATLNSSCYNLWGGANHNLQTRLTNYSEYFQCAATSLHHCNLNPVKLTSNLVKQKTADSTEIKFTVKIINKCTQWAGCHHFATKSHVIIYPESCTAGMHRTLSRWWGWSLARQVVCLQQTDYVKHNSEGKLNS